MDKAAEQALRAGQIIRRLRDFVARGESERRVEDVKKLVEEASALALVGAKEKASACASSSIPRVDFVLADKVQIQQVLLNLMRNAIEAMEEQPTARARRLDGAGAGDNMVEISVADTGAGIAPEISAQLFQPFVTTKRQGMGVGLSISRTIIEAHGGAICAAAKSRGRNDVFASPCRRDQGGGRRCRLTSAIVHVIDDDDALRESLTFLLRTAEHRRCRTYASATAFLDALPEPRVWAASSPTCACPA